MSLSPQRWGDEARHLSPTHPEMHLRVAAVQERPRLPLPLTSLLFVFSGHKNLPSWHSMKARNQLA